MLDIIGLNTTTSKEVTGNSGQLAPKTLFSSSSTIEQSNL